MLRFFQSSVQLFSAQKSLHSIPHTSTEKCLEDKRSHIISNTNAAREFFFLKRAPWKVVNSIALSPNLICLIPTAVEVN